jgi:hypothetical protein
MRTAAKVGLACVLALGSAVGCSSGKVTENDNAGGADGAGGSSATAGPLELSIGPDSRTFVELGTPAEVTAKGNGETSIAWDIAFQGRDVFINGGISGPGSSKAFGPLSAPTYKSDTAPEVPLMLQDRAGGALLDWYDYVGTTHQLYSRYHVYGLRDGERFYKLQILGYYGELQGAPVSALYRVRYAEVLEGGLGEVHDVSGIDAIAGGSKDDDSAPSSCLTLDTEEITSLTPAEAAVSDAWQLCFRREAIAVNGGLSGPRGMEAVDLQADLTPEETEAEIKTRTAASEQAPFDDADFAALSDPALVYQADGVVTAFAQRWLEPGSDPLALSASVWLVQGADGASLYLMQLSDLSGDPAQGPATLSLEAKSVRAP